MNTVVPTVLFVDRSDAGCSQIAAAIFNRMAAGRGLARSAGIEPAEEVVPTVSAVLAEIYIDLAAARPVPVTPTVTDGVDVLVAIGVADLLETTGVRKIDWDLPADVEDIPLSGVRGLRDEIERMVSLLTSQMGLT